MSLICMFHDLVNIQQANVDGYWCSWTINRATPPCASQKNIAKTATIANYRWILFSNNHSMKNMVLSAGNYEFPFEVTLPRNVTESIDGIPEASITYNLRATIKCPKFLPNIEACRDVWIVPAFDLGLPETPLVVSRENTWSNRLKYSIILSHGAAAFGDNISLDMRFTPLVEGLRLGESTIQIFEIWDIWIQRLAGLSIKWHRSERQVSTWQFQVTREKHWHDVGRDGGRANWAITKQLHLPDSWQQCTQDLDHHGIKVRHKIKITVPVISRDGHTSQVWNKRKVTASCSKKHSNSSLQFIVTLPISIISSPNAVCDSRETRSSPTSHAAHIEQEITVTTPPSYGDHLRDPLYKDCQISNV